MITIREPHAGPKQSDWTYPFFCPACKQTTWHANGDSIFTGGSSPDEKIDGVTTECCGAKISEHDAANDKGRAWWEAFWARAVHYEESGWDLTEAKK